MVGSHTRFLTAFFLVHNPPLYQLQYPTWVRMGGGEGGGVLVVTLQTLTAILWAAAWIQSCCNFWRENLSRQIICRVSSNHSTVSVEISESQILCWKQKMNKNTETKQQAMISLQGMAYVKFISEKNIYPPASEASREVENLTPL